MTSGDFDPSSVPLYPLARAEMRRTEGGFEGLVDDQVLATGPLVVVQQAIIDEAARLAGQITGRDPAIRLRGTAPGGEVFHMVVTSDGEIYDTTEQSAPTAPAGGRAKRSKRSQAGPPSPDLEDPRRRFHPIMLVIVGFPVLMICFFAWLLFFRTEAPPPATVAKPPARQLPVTAPPGFSPVARWAVPVGISTGLSGESTLAADEDQVIAATGNSDRVAAFDAGTGIQEWETKTGSLTAGPALSAVEGDPVVLAATASTLIALDPEDGEQVGEWELDTSAGGVVQFTATGPIVSGEGNTAQIVAEGKLVDRVMPAGAVPVAPGPEGSLVAVTRDRVYTSTSSRISGNGAPITPGGRGQVTVAGWTGDTLVLAYEQGTASMNGRVRLAGYAAEGWNRLWRTSPVSSASSEDTTSHHPLLASPNGQWGIFGSTAISLATGETKNLGEWSTTTVGDSFAFGTNSTGALTATLEGIQGRATSSSDSMQALAPQALVGPDAYLIAPGEGSKGWLYALTPTPTQPAPTPSESSKKQKNQKDKKNKNGDQSQKKKDERRGPAPAPSPRGERR